MQSRRGREQDELFVAGTLLSLIPEDHALRRIDTVLDLSWIHEAVRPAYCQDNGRPSIDPESALRLMLAGFLEGIVHDRALMRRAQTDLAFRWFAGYRLDEKLPDHSSLTRIRQRWGAALFKQVFERVVLDCVCAGLVKGDTVHIDATLIRADVSWESLSEQHAEQVLLANGDGDGEADSEEPPHPRRGRQRRKPAKKPKRSATDPDASMATSNRSYHLEPSYKQHTAVDDYAGVVVDVAVDTGQANEGQQLPEQLNRIVATTGFAPKVVTADKSYAHASNYAELEARNADAVIPPQADARRKEGTQRIPSIRFKYDAHHDRVRCPAGIVLPHKQRTKKGTTHRARSRDCQGCALRQRCFSPAAPSRSILIVDGYPALLRARRRRRKGWDDATRNYYTRHRWHVEGVHGRSKAQHRLNRAVRRGLENVRIQAYLTAIAMNVKKLADHATIGRIYSALYNRWTRIAASSNTELRMAA